MVKSWMRNVVPTFKFALEEEETFPKLTKF